MFVYFIVYFYAYFLSIRSGIFIYWTMFAIFIVCWGVIEKISAILQDSIQLYRTLKLEGGRHTLLQGWVKASRAFFSMGKKLHMKRLDWYLVDKPIVRQI